MSIVVFDLESFERIQALARTEPLETCAVGLVARAGSRAGKTRFVVRDFTIVPDHAYLTRGHHYASLTPQFCMELANSARAQDFGVILAHTHPGPAALENFSEVDDQGERALREYFERRLAGKTHFSALITQGGGRCRILGQSKIIDVQLVGKNVRRLPTSTRKSSETDAKYDRQLRAFGPDGHSALTKTRVAIIGLGGTGSIIAQELAHLGVIDYLLVDPDVVDTTNLNRLLGASADAIGAPKVTLADGCIKNINPAALSEVVIGDVVDAHVAKLLLDTDFIFLCTDSHASRAVVNQLAYQYLIPCIDMGVAIHVQNGTVAHVVGRTQMLASGLACLICANWIDANQVRQEMMSEEQQLRDPYFVGGGVPQPAVISLNGAVASVAITTFLAAMTSFPADARMVLYDAVRGAMRPTTMIPQQDCIVCSSNGALARGESWPLPTRHDPAHT